MKEDRYVFPMGEWKYTTNCDGNGGDHILTRKKPKVKVEWRMKPGANCDCSVYSYDDYGTYFLVQFRVMGWKDDGYVYSFRDRGITALLTPNCTVSSFNLREPVNAVDVIHIGLDARDKWSAPVLLPESVYVKLDNICRALEEKANDR